MSARERFLLSLLTLVFVFQGGMFLLGFLACVKAENPRAACPEIGKRFDSTSQSMLSAVIGLLAGSAMGKP